LYRGSWQRASHRRSRIASDIGIDFVFERRDWQLRRLARSRGKHHPRLDARRPNVKGPSSFVRDSNASFSKIRGAFAKIRGHSRLNSRETRKLAPPMRASPLRAFYPSGGFSTRQVLRSCISRAVLFRRQNYRTSLIRARGKARVFAFSNAKLYRDYVRQSFPSPSLPVHGRAGGAFV